MGDVALLKDSVWALLVVMILREILPFVTSVIRRANGGKVTTAQSLLCNAEHALTAHALAEERLFAEMTERLVSLGHEQKLSAKALEALVERVNENGQAISAMDKSNNSVHLEIARTLARLEGGGRGR